jgi:hypothetical protein
MNCIVIIVLSVLRAFPLKKNASTRVKAKMFHPDCYDGSDAGFGERRHYFYFATSTLAEKARLEALDLIERLKCPMEVNVHKVAAFEDWTLTIDFPFTQELEELFNTHFLGKSHD